jgi:hypothetical protein
MQIASFGSVLLSFGLHWGTWRANLHILWVFEHNVTNHGLALRVPLSKTGVAAANISIKALVCVSDCHFESNPRFLQNADTFDTRPTPVKVFTQLMHD